MEARIAVLGVGLAAFSGEGELILSPPLRGSSALVFWRPRSFPSDRFIEKGLCGLLWGGERAILVDNLEHVARRRLLRRHGPNEERVDPLHVVLEIEAQKWIPALIHRGRVINEKVVRVVHVGVGAREPCRVSGEKRRDGEGPMQLRHHILNRRREMEVLLIFLLLLLPMGVVGVAEVEALERREESTDDLQGERGGGRKGDLGQARGVPLERTDKIQMFVRLEVLNKMKNGSGRGIPCRSRRRTTRAR